VIWTLPNWSRKRLCSSFLACASSKSSFFSPFVTVRVATFAAPDSNSRSIISERFTGNYDARLRVLILHVADLLKVPLSLVELYEQSLIEMLSKDLPVQSEEQQKEVAKRSRNKKIRRYMMIGLVGLSGGAIMGLTGGLAAPFVAAGAGAIIGSFGTVCRFIRFAALFDCVIHDSGY
jgi:hypothetical protein